MATLRLCTDPPRSTHCTPYGLHVHLLPLKWCFTVASEGGIWSPGLSVTRRKASASATFLSNTFKGSSYTWRKQACVSSYINNGTLTLAHSNSVIWWPSLQSCLRTYWAWLRPGLLDTKSANNTIFILFGALELCKSQPLFFFHRYCLRSLQCSCGRCCILPNAFLLVWIVSRSKTESG